MAAAFDRSLSRVAGGGRLSVPSLQPPIHTDGHGYYKDDILEAEQWNVDSATIAEKRQKAQGQANYRDEDLRDAQKSRTELERCMQEAKMSPIPEWL